MRRREKVQLLEEVDNIKVNIGCLESLFAINVKYLNELSNTLDLFLDSLRTSNSITYDSAIFSLDEINSIINDAVSDEDLQEAIAIASKLAPPQKSYKYKKILSNNPSTLKEHKIIQIEKKEEDSQEKLAKILKYLQERIDILKPEFSSSENKAHVIIKRNLSSLGIYLKNIPNTIPVTVDLEKFFDNIKTILFQTNLNIEDLQKAVKSTFDLVKKYENSTQKEHKTNSLEVKPLKLHERENKTIIISMITSSNDIPDDKDDVSEFKLIKDEPSEKPAKIEDETKLPSDTSVYEVERDSDDQKPRKMEAFQFLSKNIDFFKAPFGNKDSNFPEWATNHADILARPSKKLQNALGVLPNKKLYFQYKTAVKEHTTDKLDKLLTGYPVVTDAILEFKTTDNQGKTVIDIWREKEEKTVIPVPTNKSSSQLSISSVKILNDVSIKEKAFQISPEELLLLREMGEQIENLEQRSQNCWQSSKSKNILLEKKNSLEIACDKVNTFLKDRTEANLSDLSEYVDFLDKKMEVQTYCLGRFTSSSSFFPFQDENKTQKVVGKIRDFVNRNDCRLNFDQSIHFEG